MTIDIGRADSFLAAHGRLLDRRRFALLTGEATPAQRAAVLARARSYRNGDGGYGWGLEPDLRTPALRHTGYTFFVDPPTDLLYEYRKDLFAYAVIIGLLTLSRQIELGNQEAAEARKEAQESGRLTLKSGGRTIVKGSRRYRDRLAPPQDAPPHTDA
ncbi:hypothetical protein [Micromonospora sp. SH-82]|uniref:hypothetical protein n=1 Tax=Micromonospora sp. SH-82 TaxID=3132938 RepID=UPI003EBDA984